MAMFEKLMNALNFDDSYDEFEEEGLYEDEMEEVAEEGRKGRFGNLFLRDQTKEEKNEFGDSEEASQRRKTKKSFSSRNYDNTSSHSSGNVYSLGSHETTVVNILLTSFDDVHKITTHLRTGRICVVDFNNLGMKDAQRSLDFVCGVCDAIDADIRKAASVGSVFLITPNGVNTILDNVEETKRRGVLSWD